MAYSQNIFNRKLRIELQKIPGADAKFAPGQENREFIAWEYPMHIRAEIIKSLTLTKNQAKVTLWNLSKQSKKYMQNPNGVIRILAGYGDEMQLVFSGRVLSVEHDFQPPDTKTEILCGGVLGYKLAETKNGKPDKNKKPVYINVNSAPMTISKRAGSATWGQIFQEVASYASTGLVIHEDLKIETLHADLNFTGTVGEFWDGMRIYHAEYGYMIYAAQNQIVIMRMDDELESMQQTQRFQVVNRESGLISATDATKQISSDVSAILEKQNWTRRMIKVQSLFLPLIDINAGVKIESTNLSETKDMQTVYGIVDDCEWILSNYEEDFYITFFVVQQKEK
jgi:hypothetical protein